MAPQRVHVLDEDPELAGDLRGAGLEEARNALWAVALQVPADTFEQHRYADLARGGFGLLILDGLLVRRVGQEHRRSAEVLGPGDVLRPWQHDGEEATMPLRTAWRAIEPLRLAVLDRPFAQRAGAFPEVTGQLVGRALQRSRTLAAHLAILHHPRVERRIVLLLWHLAERWGRVTPDGVVVRLPLTHELLADLVAARRPSVTSCLSSLSERGLVVRHERGWLLTGEPPFADEVPEDLEEAVGERSVG